jgi:hypothetical protein
MTLWHEYWSWVGGNIGAMPLEALITAAVTVALWPQIKPLVRWLRRELGGAALEEAKAARRIAADLYEHHTGRPHPDAPAPESESEAK